MTELGALNTMGHIFYENNVDATLNPIFDTADFERDRYAQEYAEKSYRPVVYVTDNTKNASFQIVLCMWKPSLSTP